MGQVLGAAVSGNCMSDSYDWLVLFTFMMGNILWQPAVIMQVSHIRSTASLRFQSLAAGYQQLVLRQQGLE